VDGRVHFVNSAEIRQTLRTHNQRARCPLTPQCPSRTAVRWPCYSRLIPKRIKVKPIVRCKPRVILETIDVTLRPMLDVFSPAVAVQDYFLGKSLEKNFVAVASVIQTKEQDDGTMHHGGDKDRADWKGCRSAEEVTLRGLAIACRPVTYCSNEIASVQAFLYFEQCIRSIRNDDSAGDLRIKRIKKTRDVVIMNNIHQDLEWKFRARHAERAQNFEATKMRAQKNATLAAFDLMVKYFTVMKFYLEVLESAGKQIDSIENGRGEAMKMAKHMPPVGWTTAYAL